ncbi:MAG TPA: GNAT family N-acetyltransferase [Candidatus Kapabacteria bacterium]|nr:GNAT family N-acetyltransferase [Candidatus Kapabacteria bacterium]
MINIRAAEAKDTGIILSLIKELAEYENLSDSVVATEESILKYAFVPNPLIHILIAEYNNEIAGFALYYYNFSTFVGKPGIYLEDVFIKEVFRGYGIGKLLLQRIAQITIESNFGRFEWSVLNWNPARKFYEHLGAKALEEWKTYRIDGNELRKLAENK